MPVASITRHLQSACLALSLALPLALCACQPVPPPALPAPVAIKLIDGTGSIVFNAPITAQSRTLLIGDIDKLVALGARTIRLAINSPGGEIEAAQSIVTHMKDLTSRQGITFEAYNLHVVASAATYVYLNAQKRFTNRNSAFLFHASGLVSSGPVTAARLREEADKLDVYDKLVQVALQSRTKLTEAEARTYVRRTVLLNADDALRDGVAEAVMDYTQPTPGYVISFRPNPPPTKPTTP